MRKKELIKELAKLQTINDQLLSEIQYLDFLVKQIGFENGLSTLKSAALDLLEESNNSDEDKPEFGDLN